MKTNIVTFLMAGSVLLSLAATSRALEKEAKAEAEQAPAETIKPAEPVREKGAVKKPDKADVKKERRHEQFKEARGEMAPYLGIAMGEASPELRAQLGLPEGFGIVVREVMDGSPADKAGLKRHDVIVRLDDQRIANAEQFAALVRSREPGSQITLDIRRGGAEQNVVVKVGEHEMPPLEQMHGGTYDFRAMPPGGMLPRFDAGKFKHAQEEWHERMEKFREQMQEYGERMRDWAKNPHEGPMPKVPQAPRYQEMPGAPKPPKMPEAGRKGASSSAESSAHALNPQGGEVTVHSETKVTRREESGEYTVRKENGEATFRVRTRDGDVKEWPINTPEQRAAVPEHFRAILQDLEGTAPKK